MRSIALTEFTKFKTADVIRQIIEVVPPTSGGVTLPEMRGRMKLLDRLDAAKDGVLLLEDAEYQKLRTMLSAFPFGLVHPDLIRIADAIETAPRAEPSK